jgi:transcriptional regulator with XRE-family HTH domain
MRPPTGAERYIAERLEEPGAADAYEVARRRIDDIDRVVHTIEDRRTQLGLSKAELARRVGVRPEAVRRLLSGNPANPTLSTVVSLASALDLAIVAVPAGTGGRSALPVACERVERGGDRDEQKLRVAP